MLVIYGFHSEKKVGKNSYLLTVLLSIPFQEVTSQIWATLYDYPCLKDCQGLKHYINKCVRVSWGLVNQVRRNIGICSI